MSDEKRMAVPPKGGFRPEGLSTGIRTFEIVAEVNGLLEGGLEDWPQQVQDAVMAALERKAAEVQLPLTIVASYCDMDYGENEKDDRPFVRIIASEVVAKDEGFEKRMIDEMLSKARH